MSSKKTHRLSAMLPSQSGAVLPLIALIAVILVLYLAFSIDLTRVGSAHQKQGRVAELASLAALEAFMAADTTAGTTDPEKYSLRLAAAKKRAEEILDSGENVLQGGGQTTTQLDSASFELVETTNMMLPSYGGSSDDGGRDNVGEITPGRWWFSSPNAGCPATPSTNNCPCNGSTDTSPCFQPNTTGVETEATAFQVAIRSHTSNPIFGVFSKAAGTREQFQIENLARAALVPRQVVFAIDLSNSIAFETHRAPGLGADFQSATPPMTTVAYALNNASCPVNVLGAKGTLGSPDVVLHDPNYNWYGHPNPAAVQPPVPPNRPANPPSSPFARYFKDRHYKDDYVCRELDFDLDGNSDGTYLVEENSIGTADICVDVACSATEKYRGPEPLSTILAGIHQSLLDMEKLAVPGDQIMLIGFDENIVDARKIGFTSAKITAPQFTLAKNITNVDMVSTLAIRHQRAFFPVYPGYTDIPQVLLDSMKELGGLPSVGDAWIAIFTDGLGTCAHFQGGSPDFAGETFLTGSAPTFNFANPTKPCLDPITDSDVAGFTNLAEFQNYLNLKSMAEASTIAGGTPLDIPSGFRTLAESGISVHTFLFGDFVQPHTLVRKSPNGGCYTDAGARAADLPFTNAGHPTLDAGANDFADISASNPFLRVNVDLHESLSKPTQGTFNPIRTPCNPDLFTTSAGVPASLAITGATFADRQADCKNNEKILKILDAACDAAPALPPSPGPTDGVVGYNGDAGLPNNLGAIIDQGRLKCDPRCRTTQEQVTEQIKELFSVNPFVLVEGVS